MHRILILALLVAAPTASACSRTATGDYETAGWAGDGVLTNLGDSLAFVDFANATISPFPDPAHSWQEFWPGSGMCGDTYRHFIANAPDAHSAVAAHKSAGLATKQGVVSIANRSLRLEPWNEVAAPTSRWLPTPQGADDWSNVHLVAASWDGRFIALRMDDWDEDWIHVIDNQGANLAVMPMRASGDASGGWRLGAAAFSPDGFRLALAGSNETEVRVFVVDVSNGTSRPNLMFRQAIPTGRQPGLMVGPLGEGWVVLANRIVSVVSPDGAATPFEQPDSTWWNAIASVPDGSRVAILGPVGAFGFEEMTWEVNGTTIRSPSPLNQIRVVDANGMITHDLFSNRTVVWASTERVGSSAFEGRNPDQIPGGDALSSNDTQTAPGLSGASLVLWVLAVLASVASVRSRRKSP